MSQELEPSTERDKAIALLIDVNNSVYRHTVQDWSLFVNTAQLLTMKDSKLNGAERNFLAEAKKHGAAQQAKRNPTNIMMHEASAPPESLYEAYNALGTVRHIAGEASYPLYVVEAYSLGKGIVTNKALRNLVTEVWRDERGAVAVANKVKPSLQASLIRELDDIVSAATKSGARTKATVTARLTKTKRIIEKIPAATQRATRVRQATAKTQTLKELASAREAALTRATQVRKAASVAQGRRTILSAKHITPKVSAATQRAAQAQQTAARARALNALASYRKAALGRKAVSAAQAQATVNAVAATGNVAATREVIAAIATQIATQASARGMTAPQIRQATQAAIEQMTMTSAQSATATGTWIEAQQATGTAARAATRAQATTATAAQVNIKAGVQPQARTGTSLAPDTELAPSVKSQPATKQQAATLTDIAVKTQPKTQPVSGTSQQTTTITDTKTKPQQKTKPGATVRGSTTTITPVPEGGGRKRGKWFDIDLPDGTKVKLTPKQYAGIVAWRQGLFYILVYPPYGKAQTIYTRKPVPGIYYARGPQSPQRSAAVVGGGKLPRSFEVAMGIAKVRVTPGAKARPQLTFRSVKVTPELGVIRKVRR
jgi:hypothetical protein